MIRDSKTSVSTSAQQAQATMPQTAERRKIRPLSRMWAFLQKAFRRVFPPSASVPLLLHDSPEGLQNALSTIRQLVQEGYSVEAVCIGQLQEPPQCCLGCMQCQVSTKAREAYNRQKELVDEILSLCRYARFAGLPDRRFPISELPSRRNKDS